MFFRILTAILCGQDEESERSAVFRQNFTHSLTHSLTLRLVAESQPSQQAYYQLIFFKLNFTGSCKNVLAYVLNCINLMVEMYAVDQDNLSGLTRTSTNEELPWESREQASFPSWWKLTQPQA